MGIISDFPGIRTPAGDYAVKGILEQYRVSAGSDISAGKFVRFITDNSSATINNGAHRKDTTTTQNEVTTTSTETIFTYSCIVFPTALLLDNDRVLLAYSDVSNHIGAVVIITISGDTITFGQTVTFNSTGAVNRICLSLLNASTAVVVYVDTGNNTAGSANVLGISGTSITVGPKYIFNNGQTGELGACAVGGYSVAVAYALGSGAYTTKACVLNVNGYSISVGTPISMPNSARDYSIVALDYYRALVCYCSYGVCYAEVFALNGTSITRGTAVVFENSWCYRFRPILVNAEKVLIAYGATNNYTGKAAIISTSGTSAAVGGICTFNNGETYYIQPTLLAYDKVAIGYADRSNGAYATSCIININGTTPTALTPVVFRNNGRTGQNADAMGFVYLGGLRVLAIYDYGANTNDLYGTYKMLYLNPSGNTIEASKTETFTNVSNYERDYDVYRSYVERFITNNLSDGSKNVINGLSVNSGSAGNVVSVRTPYASSVLNTNYGFYIYNMGVTVNVNYTTPSGITGTVLATGTMTLFNQTEKGTYTFSWTWGNTLYVISITTTEFGTYSVYL